MDKEMFRIASDRRLISDDELPSLALSIKNYGLLNPISVRRAEDGALIILAGRRRFRALTEILGLEELEQGKHYNVLEIEPSVIDDTIIQLIENIERRDLSPTEVASFVYSIHDQCVKKYGRSLQGVGGSEGWTTKKTADLIGKSVAFVSRMLSIYENKEKVKNCESMTDALKTIRKMKASEIIKQAISEKIKKRTTANNGELCNNLVTIEGFKNADALEYVPTLEDKCIDLVYTDMPYGVDYALGNDECPGRGKFDDSQSNLELLLDSIIPEFYRVMKDDTFGVIWCSHTNAVMIAGKLEKVGLRPVNTLIYWVKTGLGRRTRNEDKLLINMCETAVYFRKGSPNVYKHGTINVFPFSSDLKKRIHLTQKPVALNEAIISTLTEPGSVVLDPFAGSGSTAKACMRCNMMFLGCEKDPVIYNAALDSLMENLDDKTDTEDEIGDNDSWGSTG